MASQQGQLQALITEIEALLGRAAPKLPWMGSGEVSEQRRVMGQALNYLQELQSTPGGTDWGLVASPGNPIAAATTSPETAAAAADSQQVLQALLQEMQYLRAQMVQPLTSEVIALQQQRETLKHEVRQLEQERLQRATAPPPSPDWVNEIVTQLRSSLVADLTPKLQALPSAPTDDPAWSGLPSAQNLLAGADPLPQLSPQQRLEQLRQIQSQTDGMLLKLDANLRAVFESLDQSIQSYCDTLNQGLGAMHGLGQQGEFVFRTFINHLAEQLQEEGSALAEQLASQQALARLQGDMDDSDSMDALDASETDAQDDLMDAVVDFDDVELDDLSEFDGNDDFVLEEEVTLFQLDEEFEDWSEAEEDAAWSERQDDREDKTIIQTEPIAWEVATGQTAAAQTATVTDDAPTVAYTEEIDALYDNLFGMIPAPDAAAPGAPSDAVEATVDEQLWQADTSELVDRPPEAAIAEPATAEPPPWPEADDTSLDLDFLLEAPAPATDAGITAPPPDEPPLETLLGPEMAAELSPHENAETAPSDTITSLTELLPESEQPRPPDPFATFDETADTFIPASPDENLLDTEREVARPQVDLSLDDDTFGMLSSDLSRLEGSTPDETLDTSRLSDALELDDAFPDVVAPEISAVEPAPINASATVADPAPVPAEDADNPEEQSFELTAVEDEGTDNAADQLAAEDELFSELFDEAAEPPSPGEFEDDVAPSVTSQTVDDEVGALTLEATAWAAGAPENTADADIDADTDADLELTALFGETDANDEPDELEWTGEDDLISEAAEIFPIAEGMSDATAPPPTDSAGADDPATAEANNEATADDSPLVLELETLGEAPANDSDDDILPRLDLDELELFDAPPLGAGPSSDRSSDPESSDGGLDFPDPPATDSDPADVEASLEDFFNSDDLGNADLPAVTEPPATAETLSLDRFFDEPATPPAVDETGSGLGDEASQESVGNSSDVADWSDPPESPTTMSTLFEAADSNDGDLTLESALDDTAVADDLEPDLILEDAFDEEPDDRASDFTLEDAFGDDEAPSNRDADFTLDDAFGDDQVLKEEPDDRASDFTLEDAFGDNEAPSNRDADFTLDDAFGDDQVLKDEPDDRASDFTLEDAFGDGEAPSNRDADFTLDDAFGDDQVLKEEPGDRASDFTLEDAFGDGEAPSNRDADFTLDDAFGDDQVLKEEPGDRASDFTLEDAFGDDEAPSNRDADFTLEDAFGDNQEPDDRAANLTLEDAFGDAGESADDAPSMTLGDGFGDADDLSAAADNATDFTLEDAFGETAGAAAPDSDADLTLANALGDRTPSASVEAAADNATLDDFAAAVSAPPPEPSSANNFTPDAPIASADPVQPVTESLSIMDDLDFDLEATTGTDEAIPPELTLDADLFGGADEPPTKPNQMDAIAPDQLIDNLELGDVPDEIDPIADDVSLETWGTDLDAAPSRPATAEERLDFGSLAGDLAADPEPDEPAAPQEPAAPSAADWLADSPDLVLPNLDAVSDRPPDEARSEADGIGATPPAAPPELPTVAEDLLAEISAPDSTPPVPSTAEDTAASVASPPIETTSAASAASGLAIAATADDGLQIVSDVPSEALMQALATLPESAIADAPTAAVAAPADAPLPPPESTVSGSITDGYRLSFAAASSDAAIDRALIGAPAAATAGALASNADDEPDHSQLQREYGRRLTSWQGMVAATSLPFATVVDLSNLTIPDPEAPDAPAPTSGSKPSTAAAALPTESGLSVTGSVDEGFAIALPDAPSLLAILWPELAADDDAAAAATSVAASPAAELAADAPLTNDELATLFPPEANVVDMASPAALNDRELPEPTGADETEFPVAEPADEEPPGNDAPADDDTGLADQPFADEPAEPAASDSAVAEEAATGSEPPRQEELELSQTLEALDLSMEEIPEAEIAADEAFQFAFDDAMSVGDRPEEDEFLSAEAIADLDTLTTDQDILPTARETAPTAPPAETEAPSVETTDLAGSDDSVFASSGRLATLGDDPAAPLPDDDEAPAPPAEEWFLGIDLGTSGLSAVLMEHHSGSAHPLCWVPENAPADATATFRMPTVATLPTAVLTGDAPFELLTVGTAAATPPAATPDQRLLHTLRPLLRAGIPHHDSSGLAIPRVQWSDTEALPLQQVLSTVTALLGLVSQPERAGLHLAAIGLEPDTLATVLASLQGIVMGLPTNWSDTYCFNLREAALAAGLVETADQVFFVEEAIAAILSGLPDPSDPAPPSNRPAQALYQCHWQGGTVVIGSGAACTEVGIGDLPQPLDAISRDDFKLRNLSYGGDALDLDIICQLLLPSERRQPLTPGSRRSPNRGWGWQAALPEVANAHWDDLQLDAFDLPRLAEPDAGLRQQLRQHLEASPLGQSLLEAARYLKLILQHQNQYQLELADQSWRVLRRDLESRVLVPYIQRINQQVNALLSQTGLASQGINQVICTGGNASFGTIAKWLRQKFPNATIIQDTYPSNRPQTCSRVAYGLVNLCRYPQILDVPRHQYSDYFLLHEMMRVMPDAPLPLDGILHLLEAQGINVSACQPRIVAILEGHLPPGLLPDLATRELLSRDTRTSRTYQDLAAGTLFTQQTRNIYMVNVAQRDRLREHLALLMQDKQQSLTEPLIAQLVAV